MSGFQTEVRRELRTPAEVAAEAVVTIVAGKHPDIALQLAQFAKRSTFDTFYQFTEAHLSDDERTAKAYQMIAGVDAIKPLKLKYRANFPMVPLVLTAVAAEPNLTVTSFIYGDRAFKPMGHPTATIDARRLARDGTGRLNYPMVLARTKGMSPSAIT